MSSHYVLKIQYINKPPETRNFGARVTTIGREAGDIVLGDPQSSGRHAEIHFENDQVRVKDLGSTNGTYLSGQRTPEFAVAPGQSFSIGQTVLTLMAVHGAQQARGAGGGKTIVAMGGVPPRPPGAPPGAPPRPPGAPPAAAPAAGAPPSGFGAPPPGAGAPPSGFGAPPPGAGAPPPSGFGAPPSGPGAPPAGFGAPPSSPSSGPGAPAGAPPAGFGAPPAGAPPSGFGAPPPGAPPSGFGAPPRGAPPSGFGAPPPGAPPSGPGAPPSGFGAPPPGAPPSGPGAPPSGFGAPPPGAPPSGPGAPASGFGAPPPGSGPGAPGGPPPGGPAPGGFGQAASGLAAAGSAAVAGAGAAVNQAFGGSPQAAPPGPMASASGGEVRGDFSGTGGELLGQLLVGYLLTLVTFGIYGPWFICKFFNFVAQRITFGPTAKGTVRFRFDGQGGELFVTFLVGYLLTIVTFGIYGAWFVCKLTKFYTDNLVVSTDDGNEYQLRFDGEGGQLLVTFIVGYLLTFVTLGIYMPWFTCKLNKWFSEHTKILQSGQEVGDMDFTGEGGELLVTFIIGYLLTAITLGIYMAWFQVNLLKFNAEHTKFSVAGKRYTLRFDGQGGELFVIILVGYLLSIITLGIYFFWFMAKLLKWQASNTAVLQEGVVPQAAMAAGGMVQQIGGPPPAGQPQFGQPPAGQPQFGHPGGQAQLPPGGAPPPGGPYGGGPGGPYGG